MRPALHALHDTGSKTTGIKEFDNVYYAMAQDFGMSGVPDQMTARS